MCRFVLLALIPKLAAVSGHGECPETVSSALLQLQTAHPLKVHINESLETDSTHRMNSDVALKSATNSSHATPTPHAGLLEVAPSESLVAASNSSIRGEQMQQAYALSNGARAPRAAEQARLTRGKENVSTAQGAMDPTDFVLESAREAYEAVSDELQREIYLNTTISSGEVETRSKIVLALINAFALGMCGIDRCYMGQWLLGTLKFVSLGGLGVWMLLDNVVIFMNCLLRSPSIDLLGYHTAFDEWEVGVAFWVSITAAVLYLWSCCSTIYDSAVREKPVEDDDEA
mmetsp:Transcript_46521/g.108449  ORF Transcript_46521/g.108449 Transcript_46521/m.108449 type:complete len:288 (+) Transcript_46521:53-916(+)